MTEIMIGLRRSISAVATFGVLALALISGCVAIPNDVTLVIESTPEGSNVVSSDGWQCSTPCKTTVRRDSQFDLRFSLNNHESVSANVEIPKFIRSRKGTYIGAGVGAIVGLFAGNISFGLTDALVSAFTGGTETGLELTTGERFFHLATGALLGGALGLAVDQIIDQRRIKQPERVNVVMQKSASPGGASVRK